MLSLLFATLFAVTPVADAGVHIQVSLPGINIVADPWSPYWVPPARAGYRWVAGHYDAWGAWTPGHWVPTGSRAGYAWVNGYWTGSHYVDGYWRPHSHAGHVWVEPRWHGGRYVAGYWAAERREDRQEYREDARERVEDRREYVEDRHEYLEDRHEYVEDRREYVEDHHDHGKGKKKGHH